MKNHKFPTPMTPISWGELIDKITILEIKQENIRSVQALANVRRELNALSAIVDRQNGLSNLINDPRQQLHRINRKLWKVEDDIRDKERKSQFDSEFIALARSVYRLNDERAKIKRLINQILDSELAEEKSYADFQIT